MEFKIMRKQLMDGKEYSQIIFVVQLMAQKCTVKSDDLLDFLYQRYRLFVIKLLGNFYFPPMNIEHAMQPIRFVYVSIFPLPGLVVLE
ncbi:hypothetical protein T4D_10889 [Trichinella pseudospiralis]|uniref:Uncharacterized protein n=1 Tax=Trichinella pseudospiralis TaxID=6337 RepID=A0A0V1FHZ3_TRIPS|nr:hypothetical protein T4D_10889 [Trichinella pseudospiralis]